MALDLKPRKCLEMLKAEYEEYKVSPLSTVMRKAINCCSLSNAMPEIIFAEYKDTAPQKVNGAKCHEDYRDYLRCECEAHHTVRDFCDFSKHGPVLRRQKPKVPAAVRVSVRDAKHIIRQEGVFRGLLAITQIKEIERLVVTHRDGREQPMDEVLAQVINSWEVIFKRDGL
jgi:hypothetical protein